MLETIDLTNKLSKHEYKSRKAALVLRLGVLQREARKLGIPVVIVFEGWDAAGKGTLINSLLLALDPRGFTVWPTNPPNDEERLRPFLWRFWVKMPQAGRIALFDRSWYGRVLVERVEKVVPRRVWSQAYSETESFERQLAEGGHVVLKFFLHISKKEQKRRFKKLESNPATAWKVTAEDWKHHKQYARYLQATEDMLARTDSSYAPWVVVEAENRRFATVKVFENVVETLERSVAQKADPQTNSASEASMSKSRPEVTSILDQVDLAQSLTEAAYRSQLKQLQTRIRDLEHEVFLRRIPVIIVYEGWDAAGKGGNIRRLVQGLDPRGYEVIPIAAPNEVEKTHHYLWRFWMRMPKAGHIAIFDRSWYGRVLVERVEGLCAEDEWRQAYREINEMEQQWAGFGAVVVKFWLHVDKTEQLDRFTTRQKTPHKEWKITDEDWRNRDKWEPYKAAVDELLVRTSTPYARWHVIESNSKWYARTKTLSIVVNEIEKRL